MNIVLVHTGIGRCGFNSYGTSQEASFISHGLCSLSAVAKRDGHQVSLIDLRRLKGWGDFRRALDVVKPDLVGFTMMTVDFEIVRLGIRNCRKVLPTAAIVVGGPHPSIRPQDVLDLPVDYVVSGEGELVFAELLNDPKSMPRHIVGKLAELDDLPFVDRSLYPLPEKPFHSVFMAPMITVIAGRGCIYNCSFCQPAERMIFGSKVRRRSVENVITELKGLTFNSMMIHDDCLTEDENWINSFCDAYREAGFRQHFICQSRADIIVKKRDMMGRLHDAGLRMLSIGFESGNNRILKFLRKGVTAEQNYEAARVCRELGIMIDANYMLGMPTETREEMNDTVKMINAVNPEIRSASFFTPHYGTDLHKYCVDHNLLLIKDFSGYRRNPYGRKLKDVNYWTVRLMLWRSRGKLRLRHLLTLVTEMPNLYRTLKWLKGQLA